jgi:hypothetical protein
MTLAITIVARWGIWQCSDHRITILPSGKHKGDDSIKHVAAKCPDGAMLLTYAGLGETGLGRIGYRDPVSDWIRRTLRGEIRSVEETLLHLKVQATAELAPKLLPPNIAHYFLVGAFIQSRPYVAVISNVAAHDAPHPHKVLPYFGLSLQLIEADGQAFDVGYGHAIRGADRGLLAKISRRRPKNPKDYQTVLANINRRTAERAASRNCVSPSCTTSYMPPSPEGSIDRCEHRWERDDNTRDIDTVRGIPFLLFGIDTTDSLTSTMRSIELRQRGDHEGADRALAEGTSTAPDSVKPGHDALWKRD